MKKTRIAVLLIAIICAVMTGALAQEPPDKTGRLTVPWDEFKALLDLDQDAIVVSLATFQKLLAQTGIKTAPPHTLQGGNVVLTRAEFERLVGQMKAPVTPTDQLPFNHLITKAVYAGVMQRNNTDFTARFTVHVLKKGVFPRIPIAPSGTALQDLTVDGKPALLVSEGGYHKVLLTDVGEHTVTARFTVASALEKGPHKIDLAIVSTPITLLTLDLPLKDIDVEIPQARQVRTTTRGVTTSVQAVISQGHAISVRWRKKVAPTQKVPARLYSEVYHLVSIEDDALRITSDLNLNIMYSEMDGIRLAIPEGMHVLTATGEGVGERQEIEQDGETVILVPFTYGKKGAVRVRVTSELPLSETGLGNRFTGMQVQGSVRETGFVGIVLNTSAEVVVSDSREAEQIAVQRLPAQLVNQSAKPLTLAFRYLKHPYSLVLDVKKHEKISVPVATVNSGNVVTLFTEDGKIVHRLLYQVRNSAKQFLEIQLPQDADVWSVFVDNKPVESSINGEGKLLVPLIRSRSVNGSLGTFPVEVIYCLDQERFAWLGSRGATLPVVDLLISQLIWSVYLPNDYSYHYFSSTLEKEEMIRGINLLGGKPRRYDENAMKEVSDLDETYSLEDRVRRAYKGQEYASDFRNTPMEEAQVAGQMNAELEFGGRLEGIAKQEIVASAPSGGTTTGVLPIQIKIPTAGQVYRFARTVIKTEDPLTFEVVYTRSWVSRAVKWVLILFAILFLYLNRRSLGRLGRGLAKRGESLLKYYKKNERAIAGAAQSLWAPFALFGLVVISWPLSRFLSLLFFLLFGVSVAHHVMNFGKKRTPAKARSKKQTEG